MPWVFTFLAASVASIASAASTYGTPESGSGSPTHWQVGLSSKPGSCLSGNFMPQAPKTMHRAAYLTVADCAKSDPRQLFEFGGPSGQIRWGAQPDLCLDEDTVNIANCLPTQRGSPRQIFAFDSLNKILVSAAHPDHCLSVDEGGGVTFETCDRKSPWQQLHAFPSFGGTQGEVSMVANADGKLMRVETHQKSDEDLAAAYASTTTTVTSWKADEKTMKGGIRIRGVSNRCLKGRSAAATTNLTVVKSGTCDAKENRFFFHYSLDSKQTKFCNPDSNKKCQWLQCLQAIPNADVSTVSGLADGNLVKRKPCNKDNLFQKWTMPKVTSPKPDDSQKPNYYREIKVDGKTDLCLKLHLEDPYELTLRTCTATTPANWEKLWRMPYQPA